MKSKKEMNLLTFLKKYEEQFSAEKEIIECILISFIVRDIPVTNKGIISVLISKLEMTNDIEQLDVLRNCLEIVVAHPSDC